MSVTRTTSWNYGLSAVAQTFSLQSPGAPLVHQTNWSRSFPVSGSVTHGDNIRDWRERIARGESATTTLSGTSTLNFTSVGATIRHLNKNNFGKIVTQNLHSGDLLQIAAGTTAPFTGLDSVAEQRAASKYLSKYLTLSNTWRGGNFLAEIRETWHALRHPVKAFYQQTWDFAGKVRKIGGVYKKRNDYAKHLADAWLAFKFGVQPLVNDCNDAQAALEKLKNGTGHDQKVLSCFGRNSSYSKASLVWQPWMVDSGWTSGHMIRYIVSHNTVRYLVAIKATPEDRSTVANQFGVGVFDVVPAVWEAIPWSFFIDYFANIGQLLDSCRLWNAPVGWVNRTIRNSTATTHRDATIDVPVSGFNEYHIEGRPHLYALSRFVSRSASSAPSLSFRFTCPGLSSMKWLNIAALGRQVTASKPVKRTLQNKNDPYDG